MEIWPSAACIAGFVACIPISSKSEMKFITHPFQVPVIMPFNFRKKVKIEK